MTKKNQNIIITLFAVYLVIGIFFAATTHDNQVTALSWGELWSNLPASIGEMVLAFFARICIPILFWPGRFF